MITRACTRWYARWCAMSTPCRCPAVARRPAIVISRSQAGRLATQLGRLELGEDATELQYRLSLQNCNALEEQVGAGGAQVVRAWQCGAPGIETPRAIGDPGRISVRVV